MKFTIELDDAQVSTLQTHIEDDVITSETKVVMQTIFEQVIEQVPPIIAEGMSVYLTSRQKIGWRRGPYKVLALSTHPTTGERWATCIDNGTDPMAFEVRMLEVAK